MMQKAFRLGPSLPAKRRDQGRSSSRATPRMRVSAKHGAASVHKHVCTGCGDFPASPKAIGSQVYQARAIRSNDGLY